MLKKPKNTIRHHRKRPKKERDSLKRDYPKCHYCYCEPPVEKLVIEHIHPICRGGSDDIDNITISCVRCNSFKGKSTPAELLERISKRLRALDARERNICNSPLFLEVNSLRSHVRWMEFLRREKAFLQSERSYYSRLAYSIKRGMYKLHPYGKKVYFN